MATHGFDLRPQRPDLRTLNRPYEPVVAEAGPPLSSSPLSSQDENDSTSDSHPTSNPGGTKSPLGASYTSMANTSDGVSSLVLSLSSFENDLMLNTKQRPEKISPASSSKTNRSTKNKNGTVRPEESSALPHNHPLNRAARDLWREGSRTVRQPDGTVADGDVVHWMMTRKGGANASWPQLEEGQRAIEEMRKDTIDLGEIWRQYEEEEEAARIREERRIANKRRYRPRSEWNKEKAAKKATTKRALEETETAVANEDEPDEIRRAAKRVRLEAGDVASSAVDGKFSAIA